MKQGTKKVAVIGGGISGIAAAHILQKNGFSVVIFERSRQIGGVWATAYPDVHLQNIWNHYHLSDFPWPFQPDFHPSGEQIRQYLDLAVQQLGLDVRTGHEVTQLSENPQGWTLQYRCGGQTDSTEFDYVLIATGQYTQRKVRPGYSGESLFSGKTLTELDIKDYRVFENKKIAVVGFGKSALDMCVAAVTARAAAVNHVFRTPRWLLTETILGAHFTRALFCRFGTVMMTSWVQPSAVEKFLHHRLTFLVNAFWRLIGLIFRHELKRHGYFKDKAAKQRLNTISPAHPLPPDIGSKTALVSQEYIPMVAKGSIEPHHAELKLFDENGLVLSDGQQIQADIVLLCLGFDTAQFPFLPAPYREWMESSDDGTQLYRHMVHPRIPRLAFAGFNHGFMHVPIVEVGAQWVAAWWKGELVLPPVADMERSIRHIETWKRAHINYEPARNYVTSTRYHQYLDTLLKDLGLSPYRKMPNPLAELFARYEAADYQGVFQEYQQKRRGVSSAAEAKKLDT